MGALRRLIAVPIAGVVVIGSTLLASAGTPSEPYRVGDLTVSPPSAYKLPPASYATSERFSFRFSLTNETDGSLEPCLEYDVAHLMGVDPAQARSEAELYALVASGAAPEQQGVVHRKLHPELAAHQTVTLTPDATLTEPGYYQVDISLCGESETINDLFIRVLPASVTPTPTPTPPPTGDTEPGTGQRPAALAVTGGGHPDSGAGLLALAAWLVLLAGLSWRLFKRPSS